MEFLLELLLEIANGTKNGVVGMLKQGKNAPIKKRITVICINTVFWILVALIFMGLGGIWIGLDSEVAYYLIAIPAGILLAMVIVFATIIVRFKCQNRNQ